MQTQSLEKARPKGKGQRALVDFLLAGTSRCGWRVFSTGWATMRRLLGTVGAFSSRAHPAWAPDLQAPQPCVCIGQPFPTTGPGTRACSELSAGGTQSCQGVASLLRGPPQLLCEAWRLGHLLQGCSAASITMSQVVKVSEQGMQSPDLTGCCTPRCPFLADRFFPHFFFEIC